MKRTIALVTLWHLFAAAAQAQQGKPPCPPVSGAVHLPCQVDRPAIPLAEWPVPRYPEVLLDSGGGGSVRIRYTIDTLGRPVGSSVEIVRSSHDLLSRAVRQVRPGFRFEPAQRGGRAVAVWHEEEFVFSAGDRDNPFPEAALVLSRDSTADGVPRLTLGPPKREPGSARLYSNESLVDVQRMVLGWIVRRELRYDGTVRPVLCVALRSLGAEIPPDDLLRQDLARAGYRVAAMAECPGTPESVATDPPAADAPPPGWTDPFRLRVTDVVPWTRDLVLVRLDLARGESRSRYRCALQRREMGVLLPMSCTAYERVQS